MKELDIDDFTRSQKAIIHKDKKNKSDEKNKNMLTQSFDPMNSQLLMNLDFIESKANIK